MNIYKIKTKIITNEDLKGSINTVKTAKDIAKIINKIEKLIDNDEQLLLIDLDENSREIRYFEIEQCHSDYRYIDTRVVLKHLLVLNVNKFILIHSRKENEKVRLEDIRITKKLSDIANLLNIKFIDYIIINNNNYYSCVTDDVKL